ncbi:uncharacterized protein LOC132591772 [Zootoca vivipara]|uniref:uncharacterized protein LOC132591772 n=1 Tax=Zootoca vivipara TaxID=8524 RepID=UPI00293B8A70|nr:uncharacterized protein LOC132591772 [Zootoca vivipara]
MDRLLLLACSLSVLPVTANPPFDCGRNPTDFFFLDRQAVDSTDPSSLSNLGNLDFCLPGTTTWLRHAFRPRLQDTQVWELLIRSASYSIIGRAFYTIDNLWNRLTCHNGTYHKTQWGMTVRTFDPTEIGHGLWEGYTDSVSNDFWTYGLTCTHPVSTTTVQGICVRKFCCLWDLGTFSAWDGNKYVEGWLHPVGGSTDLEWDFKGPQRCGGIASDLYLLQRHDPLHPVGTAPRSVNLSEFPGSQRNSLRSAWQSNSYIQLVQKVAHATNLTDCWICAHTPAHIEQGVPFVATPLTLDQYRSQYLFTRNLTFIKPTSQYIYLSGETTGPLCRKFSGTKDHIGSSSCLVTVASDPEGNRTWIQNRTHSRPYPNMKSALTAVLYPLIAETPSAALVETFQTGRIGEPLSGLFWVCSTRAFTWVSIHMQGSCYLGHVHPGLRVTRNLPHGRRRNRRSPVTSRKPSASGETWLRALIPAYGAYSNHLDILRLTDILLRFINESEASTMSVLTELTQVRSMTLQNRLALDLLLASQGGTCKLIGAECCSYISDQTLNVTAHLQTMDSLVHDLRNIQHEGLGNWDPWSWLPNVTWLREVVKGTVYIAISLALLLFLSCCCLQSCPLATAAGRSLAPSVSLQAPLQRAPEFPEEIPMFHLGNGDYVNVDVRH